MNKLTLISYGGDNHWFGAKTKINKKMLKMQQISLKLYRCLLYVVFHNLEPQDAGLADVKTDLN